MLGCSLSIRRARGLAKGISVDGIANTMIVFPKCCNPIPGDEIIRYITKGKGVSIHRVKCKNLNISDDKSSLSSINLKHLATSIKGTKHFNCLPPAKSLIVPF